MKEKNKTYQYRGYIPEMEINVVVEGDIDGKYTWANIKLHHIGYIPDERKEKIRNKWLGEITYIEMDGKKLDEEERRAFQGHIIGRKLIAMAIAIVEKQVQIRYKKSEIEVGGKSIIIARPEEELEIE